MLHYSYKVYILSLMYTTMTPFILSSPYFQQEKSRSQNYSTDNLVEKISKYVTFLGNNVS